MQPREKISGALDSAKNTPGGYLPRPADSLQSGEVFRSLIEGFSEAILVADRDFRILESNGKAQQLLATRDPIGNSVLDFLEMPQPGQLPRTAARCIEEGAVTLECRLHCANGAQYRSLWRVSAIMDRDQ